MKDMNSVQIKYAQGCIAVKEDYKVTRIFNSNRLGIEAVFCIDRGFKPCRLCVFRGNVLTPLRAMPDFDLATFIRSKKGMYSRLDCVANVISLKGEAEIINNRVVWSNKLELDIFLPFGVAGEYLSLNNIARNVNVNVLAQYKEIILNNLGANILSREKFIVSRMRG